MLHVAVRAPSWWESGQHTASLRLGGSRARPISLPKMGAAQSRGRSRGFPPRAGSVFSTAGPELELCSGLLGKLQVPGLIPGALSVLRGWEQPRHLEP